MHRKERPVRNTIPINLIIDDRRALVVGGGRVGLRKVRSLLEAGAKVRLICPQTVDELALLADQRAIDLAWEKREYARGDAAGHLLAFACTDDKHVNRAILDDARKAHVPCCSADLNWCDGDFTTPATAKLGNVQLAVSTSGQSCRNARDVKNEIVAYLGEKREACLTVIGTSDALLPSRRRAPFHLPAEERKKLGRLITRVNGVREFFILNTCNRVEIAIVSTPNNDVIALIKRLIGFERLERHEYFALSGFEAFRHLVRVCAGMESSLLGEAHVVSQMKDAFNEAEANKWSGAALRFTAAEVMRCAKAVRHEVQGMLKVAEIDQVAVRYLTVHGDLDAATKVVVIGTGMVGTGVVKELLKLNCAITWIYHERIPELPPAAGKPQIALRSLAELTETLATADIVLSAVDSAKPVVTPAMAEALGERNLLMVDMGLPRNIDPFYDEVGRGITVADLDDLKLWHRVKTGTLNEVLARADEVIHNEYRMMQ